MFKSTTCFLTAIWNAWTSFRALASVGYTHWCLCWETMDISYARTYKESFGKTPLDQQILGKLIFLAHQIGHFMLLQISHKHVEIVICLKELVSPKA